MSSTCDLAPQCVFRAWAPLYAGHFGLASVVGVLLAHVCAAGLLLFFNNLLTPVFFVVFFNVCMCVRACTCVCVYVMKLKVTVSGFNAMLR